MRSSGEVPVENSEPGAGRDGPRAGWRRWLPRLVKPVRRVVVLLILALVVEYLVVPELVGASKDLYLLGHVNALWLAAGVALEGLSLFCYAVLTKVMLPHGSHKPTLSVLFRIDLSAAAVAHVIPAGTLGTAALGYKLFTSEGISGNDADSDDGGQGHRLDRRAERAAVALPRHLHTAGRVPAHLRDGRHHRDDRCSGSPAAGVGGHPRAPGSRPGCCARSATRSPA